MSEIIIRPYLDSDYEQVKINLIEADMFDVDMDTHEILENKIQQDSNSIFVAQIDNIIIGNIYIIDDAWFAGIFRLVVRKEYRKQDIGLKLMQTAEAYLKSRGHSQVMLFVNNKFDKLIDWYKKQGYEHTGNEFKALWKEL